jgi:hypothetical protein
MFDGSVIGGDFQCFAGSKRIELPGKQNFQPVTEIESCGVAKRVDFRHQALVLK